MKLKKMKMAVLLAVTEKPKYNYLDNEDFSPAINNQFKLKGHYTDRYYKMLMGRKPVKLNPFKRSKYDRWISPSFDADKIRRSEFKEIRQQLKEELEAKKAQEYLEQCEIWAAESWEQAA